MVEKVDEHDCTMIFLQTIAMNEICKMLLCDLSFFLSLTYILIYVVCKKSILKLNFQSLVCIVCYSV